jgi:hypothetical protein
MKQSLLIFLFCSGLSAQPSLTTAITPFPGTSIPFTTLNQSLDMTSVGANLTWDFSNFSGGQAATAEIVSAASDPDASAFPGATHVVSGLGPKRIYTMDATGWYILGIAQTGFTVVCTNSIREIKIPQTFESSSVDALNCGFSFQGLDFNRTGFAENSYDAWGTLILPNGTLTNVIRVKTHELTTDLASFQGLPITNQNDNYTYSFFAPGKTFPVLTYTETNSSQIPQPVTTVQYNSTPNISVEESEVKSAIRLLENPVSNGQISLFLPPSLPIQHVHVLDICGRTVEVLDVPETSGFVTLSLASAPHGIYLLEVFTALGPVHLRFIRA